MEFLCFAHTQTPLLSFLTHKDTFSLSLTRTISPRFVHSVFKPSYLSNYFMKSYPHLFSSLFPLTETSWDFFCFLFFCFFTCLHGHMHSFRAWECRRSSRLTAWFWIICLYIGVVHSMDTALAKLYTRLKVLYAISLTAPMWPPLFCGRC